MRSVRWGFRCHPKGVIGEELGLQGMLMLGALLCVRE